MSAPASPARTRCTPLLARVDVLQPLVDGPDGLCATTSARITGDEPVFAGHYPGLPLFPGVCVVECVHHSADATAPWPALVLAEVESARFTDSVHPGDEVVVDLAWRHDDTDQDWHCRARVTVGCRPVADVRLRYRMEGLA